MKKFKFWFVMIIIIISVIVVGIVARLYWLDDIDAHSTYYGFMASIIIAGVTAIYVILTYGILKTQELDLEIRKQYVVVPDIENEIDESVYSEPNLKCLIKNASQYAAKELEVYLLMLDGRNMKYALKRIPGLIPGEKEYFEVSFTSFPVEKINIDLKNFMESFNVPIKARNYILNDFKKYKLSNGKVLIIYFVVEYRTVYNKVETIVRSFRIFKNSEGKITLYPEKLEYV